MRSQPRIYSKHPGQSDAKRTAFAPSHGPAPHPPVHPLLQLQRSIGNQAVIRIIQAMLKVNPPGDEYEREADRVAAEVVNRIGTPGVSAVQRQNALEDEDEEKLMREPLNHLREGKGGIAVEPDMEARIEQARGGGEPLPDNIRSPLEQAFGADFSSVRVHKDAEADRLNQSLHARAFTTGHDIFFWLGEYNPCSSSGKSTLAHELTHVVQQHGPSALKGIRRLEPTVASPVIQRLPYAKAYSESETKKLLDNSEDRNSPVTNQPGHPRQHVGKWEKAERFAEQQGRTKSVYKNTDAQYKAISSALNSMAGQAALALLDVNPGVPTRQAIANVATDAADVRVVKAKKKQGAAAGEVKSWVYTDGTATQATVVVDSMGTNVNGAIHIQTAYPVI